MISSAFLFLKCFLGSKLWLDIQMLDKDRSNEGNRRMIEIVQNRFLCIQIRVTNINAVVSIRED